MGQRFYIDKSLFQHFYDWGASSSRPHPVGSRMISSAPLSFLRSLPRHGTAVLFLYFMFFSDTTTKTPETKSRSHGSAPVGLRKWLRATHSRCGKPSTFSPSLILPNLHLDEHRHGDHIEDLRSSHIVKTLGAVVEKARVLFTWTP